jgi:hypothetical protein
MTLSEAQTSRHPAGDVRSSTADSGLPLLPQDTFSTCRAHYPGGLSRCFSVGFYAAPRAGFFPRHAGLPGPNIRSASTVQLFEACSSFTRVTARRFAHPPDVGLVGRLRHRPLPGGIASQLHRHTETSCGGTCTHWWSCAISAHIGFVRFFRVQRGLGRAGAGLGSFGECCKWFHFVRVGPEMGSFGVKVLRGEGGFLSGLRRLERGSGRWARWFEFASCRHSHRFKDTTGVCVGYG